MGRSRGMSAVVEVDDVSRWLTPPAYHVYNETYSKLFPTKIGNSRIRRSGH
jgi:hypothetical protein